MLLDDAYAVAVHIPDGELYPPRWADEAAAFRNALGSRAEIGIAYGPSPRQLFDLFRCDGRAQGTLVFVHGGYWLRFDRSSWSHFAQGALTRGWDVAMVQYDLCPDVRIHEITRQVATAVTKIAGRDSGPISLTGHSAGGHLVSRMLAPGMLPDGLRHRLSAVAPISPVTDLRPLLQTSMNDQFGMDMAAAAAESPVLQPKPERPVKLWVGSDERPVFLDWSATLSAVWGVPEVVVAGRHHFDIIDALRDPQSDIVDFLTSQ